MKSFRLIVALLILMTSASAQAQKFMDTSAPREIFSIGFRAGFNTSDRTFSKDYFKQWNQAGWGIGLDLGCVVDLNMRDFLSIQPGIFLQSRSGNYSFAQDYYNGSSDVDRNVQLGRYRNYNLVIPVMASLKFNLSDRIRWIAEAGPYVQYRIKSADKDDIIDVITPQSSPSDKFSFTHVGPRRGDFGLKIGSGLLLDRKISVNVHYMAGMRQAWPDPYKGGHNKAWTFTVGYEL